MSLDEILEQLPNLSPQQRRELGLRLLELEADDDVALCNYVAAQGFAMIDEEEPEPSFVRRGEVWVVDLGLAADGATLCFAHQVSAGE
jgi:hypothetical protein